MIVPVLDRSPHSPYSIDSLLADLEGVAGEVILVLNDPQAVGDLIHHPRVDHWVLNARNPGVGRAFAMGLMATTAPVAFFLNADLHVTAPCLDALHRGLLDLPDAAVVGPEGSLVDFATLKVLSYLHPGMLSEPQQVSNVSGFLFGVRTDRLWEHGLGFDPRFTPCFFEEWDLALQVMRVGLRSYVLPVSGYDHHFGISSRDSDATVTHLGTTETLKTIRTRSEALFRRKWGPLVGAPSEADGARQHQHKA